jgi:hypothetical protein
MAEILWSKNSRRNDVFGDGLARGIWVLIKFVFVVGILFAVSRSLQQTPDSEPLDVAPADEGRVAERLAQQQSTDAARCAAQKRAVNDAKAAEVLRQYALRQHTRPTVKDLYLDGKAYAANGIKVSVSEFYQSYGHNKERLYNSSVELTMEMVQPGAVAVSIGLITENGTGELREQLLGCAAAGGCVVTLIGHVEQCIETNVLGVTNQDICLIAEYRGPQ